jgi:Na+-translocating ferredoxin:NAD+ oxidoreductase RnfC subunit
MERSLSLTQQLKAMGVVGAGGAGFPTYVKATSKVEYYIANGAECEPLVRKDVELMKNFPAEVVSGLLQMARFTGASRVQVGVKKKNARAVAAMEQAIQGTPAEMLLLGDFYPAGDEYELVYLGSGRLIPPGGIPLAVGCAVNNVETLYNVHQALDGRAVTDKFVSVTGLVNEPKSFWVPIGTTFGDLLARAGGVRTQDYALMVSGILMGRFSLDLDDVVTKTVGGLIVLPRDHQLIQRYERPNAKKRLIGKSSCDQCSYCTEMCPRYLLGYDIMPHRVMRTLGLSPAGAELNNPWAQFCCSCGLCTLYACPEDLYPREACDDAKFDLRKGGVKVEQRRELRVHPMKESRRVPMTLLKQRLKLEEFESDAPYDASPFTPSTALVKLAQHVGRPARPVVQEGASVEKGDVIGVVDEADLGVNIHASISGTVERVTEQDIQIRSSAGGRRRR